MKPPKKTREQLREETFLCKQDTRTLYAPSTSACTKIYNRARAIDIAEDCDFYKTKVRHSSVRRVLKRADERNASQSMEVVCRKNTLQF